MSGVAGGSATSPGQLLQLFRSGRVSTRRELQDISGLARSTLTFRVDALLQAGYLVEAGTGGPTGGRRAVHLVFDDRTPTVLAVDLGASHGRLAVCTAAGDVLVERVIESEVAQGPRAVLDRVAGLLDDLLTESGRDRGSVCGIGIGLPGPVVHERGRVVRPPIMPGWDDFPVAEALAERFATVAFVDNDANVMGLGEQRACHPSAHSLVFVKVGTGIGSSLVVNGDLYRGVDGAEGDIGHAKITGLDRPCACGSRGCLASVASGGALARRLREAGHPARTTRDVVGLVQRGEPAALDALREAGRHLGVVLATAVSMLNPEHVVLGGDLARVHEHLLPMVRERIDHLTQPLASANLTVSVSQLGDRAGIAGATVMVRDAVFSAAAVDAVLAAGGGRVVPVRGDRQAG